MLVTSRSYAEYMAMFDLAAHSLSGRVLATPTVPRRVL